MSKPLSERMREAADTLSEASALYGYYDVNCADWSPNDLRTEADYVEAEE